MPRRRLGAAGVARGDPDARRHWLHRRVRRRPVRAQGDDLVQPVRLLRGAPQALRRLAQGGGVMAFAPSEDLPDMPDADFRALVRRFAEENNPNDMPRHSQRRLHWREVKPWYMALSRRGWLCPNWPREFGGMGLSALKQLIMIEEFGRHGCARVNDIGIVMLGPLLMHHGTDEQKAQFLPKILSGEHIWAQGYSEPNAGSDLAAVRTDAVLAGVEWVINGQKTWATLGDDANWIFILARTDKSAKKQAGISFLLVPMDAPGVPERAIENLELIVDICEI